MRKRSGRRAEVEELDARIVPSGVPVAAGSVSAHQTLQLAGSLHGSTSSKGSPTFQVSGAVSPLGKVTAAGHGSIETVTGPNGSFSLLSRQGRLFVATDVVSTGKRSFAGVYAIQGGTRSFAGDTGSGTFVVSHDANRIFASFR